MTSTSIYTPIVPTYLYIKKHSITGLKYFGKTTKTDPYAYLGSGIKWKNHIKKHGKKHIVTIWVSDLYYDTSIIEHALHFSIENNIVESQDWANLMLENGINGGATFTGKIPWNKHKTLSEEHKAKLSIAMQGKPLTDETKAKLSIAMQGKNAGRSSWNIGVKQLIVICPYCYKTGGSSNMKRYHFDNCKKKVLTK
jgi:hypothetical protein